MGASLAAGLFEPTTADVLSFTVVGHAQPGGSKRAFRHSQTGRIMVADANRKAKPWQAVVAAAGAEAMGDRPLLSGALLVRFAFFAPRPRSHYGSGRNSNVLRTSAPRYPVVRPDLLKLARAAEDALTGACWRDDSQIVSEHLSKHYGEPARCEIDITLLDVPPAGVERSVGPGCAPAPVASTDGRVGVPLSTEQAADLQRHFDATGRDEHVSGDWPIVRQAVRA